MKKLILTIGLFLLGLSVVWTQDLLEQSISIPLKNLSLEEALYQLMDEENVRISFINKIIPAKTVNVRFRREPLSRVLDVLLDGTTIGYKVVGGQVVLFKQSVRLSRKRFTINGFLEDAKTGERLIAANIFDRESRLGTVTNEYGFYSLTLSGGDLELAFSYLGYETVIKKFVLDSDRKINLALNSDLMLKEVIIVATDENTEEIRQKISEEGLSVSEIERLPNLGGETDLVRTAHLLPGVQTGTDGVGGLHIRGGNPDHNLILIDGVPVYNISHAVGVFSIFNTSAVRSARLFKGGFSARYGGRLSSVLDVHTKEGNKKELKGRVDAGLLTSRLSLEGPISKDQSSFFVSGRYSHLDWFIKPFTRNLKEKRGETGFSGYNFYDINAKFNHAFSDQDKIYFSFYNGNDRFKNNGEQTNYLSIRNSQDKLVPYRFDQSYSENLGWGNTTAAFRWNHLYNDKLFGNTTLTYSKLATDIDYLRVDSIMLLGESPALVAKTLDFGKFQSGIEDIGIKFDFDFIPSAKHYIRFGFGATGHNFTPGVLTFDESFTGNIDEVVRGTVFNDPITSTEYALYAEDEIDLKNGLSVSLGARFTGLSVRDKNYRSFQPRLSGYWSVNNNLGFKASVSRMAQFLHLLSNSDIGLPSDLWVPATSKVKPQDSWQAVLGMDYHLDGFLDFTVEGYYKKMNNLLAITEGASFLTNWEDNVTSGEGRSYGLEFFLKKGTGKTRGWLAYSLSKTDRRFERINLGRRYPFKFDRRHDIKVVLSHRFKPWIEMSANWVFSSGFAYSLPLQQYAFELPGVPVPPINVLDYGEKNSLRMPPYHRLDVNFNFFYKVKGTDHTINVGVYNLYDRRNPLYYDIRTQFVQNDNNQFEEVRDFVQVSLIPITPSLNYTVKF